METLKAIILKGLPASGKSTWAKAKVREGGYTRINKDDLRDMSGEHYNKSSEQTILNLRDYAIKAALHRGVSPIIDDTNLAPKHEERIRQIVDEFVKETGISVEVEVKFFDIDLLTAFERDDTREKRVGRHVILKMYNQFLRKKIEYKPLPNVYICDIDGTIAKMDRHPFDWARVYEDKPNEFVLEILRNLPEMVIFVSGRDAVCEEDTLKWIQKYYNRDNWKLFMRPEGNTEKDAVIKRRIYDTHIKDKYRVKAVFDDRDQTVYMWRELGLNCLQVDFGNF